MNNIKTIAIIFMAGYCFQYFDHFHRSILAHGYSLALLVLAVFGTLYAVRALAPKQEAHEALDYSIEPQPSVLIEHQPIDRPTVLKTGQRAKQSA